MRLGILIYLIFGYTLGYAQGLDKQLKRVVDALDVYYEKAQPYSMVLNVESANYNENTLIPGTKDVQKYKMVIGNHYTYTYMKTTQVFKDSVGELLINNQKRLVEFNTFRTLTPQNAGQIILNVAKEVGVAIKSITEKDGKTILVFANEVGSVEVEYLIKNNRIKQSIHRSLNEKKERLFTLKTVYGEFTPNLSSDEKYKINGHGEIVNDEFVPNTKYTEYEIFNY